MEAKVHEATNNEAWGASSTLMQEIAQGTFNYQHFNEIMPTIYKRFTEKEAKQWRQIYKSLVLLEYLVKNGSERVVDDARSHVSMIKMMKNFHYIDEKGKDQGINVRNRAKELAELLGNIDIIKAERKKAKKNRNKYTGVGSDGGMMYSGSGIEGFGSGGSNHSPVDFYDDESPGRYDEDNSRSASSTSSSSSNIKRQISKKKEKEEKPKKTTAKEMNLFDFDDDEPVTNNNRSSKTNDDDWGEFTAENEDGEENTFTTTTSSAVPEGNQNLMLSQAFNNMSIHSTQPTMVNEQQQQLQQSQQQQQQQQRQQQQQHQQQATLNTSTPMGGIWSQASNLLSLDSLGTNTPSSINSTQKVQGPSMNSLKNASVNAGWNNWATPTSSTTPANQQQQAKKSSVFDDLLL
ncbi:MAG: hypothetical protein EXX96DRAFT_597424 [Benjaminiella poitrasii]|nr:MAG: hypothetical protein EXX96DRAFT_597424 [Benjaminiella poitrasii]